MSILFGRVYDLCIGVHPELVDSCVSSPTISPDGVESAITIPSTDFLSEPPSCLRITKLRIRADISDSKKGAVKNTDTSWIEIINLSKENQKKIKVDATVLFKAGYEQQLPDLPLIYAGHVTKVVTRKQGQDTVTRISCGSAAVVRRNVRISRSGIRDETIKDVLDWFADVAVSYGIPRGQKEIFVPIDYKWKAGFAATGNFFEELDKFCKDINFKAYIALGKLYIETEGTTNFIETVNIIEKNIKGSIRPDNNGTSKTTPELKQGISFNTFLDGRITTAKKVNIGFGDYSGDYKINTVSFKMDLNGKHWDTIVNCEKIN